jgi:hypothetical protein
MQAICGSKGSSFQLHVFNFRTGGWNSWTWKNNVILILPQNSMEKFVSWKHIREFSGNLWMARSTLLEETKHFRSHFDGNETFGWFDKLTRSVLPSKQLKLIQLHTINKPSHDLFLILHFHGDFLSQKFQSS